MTAAINKTERESLLSKRVERLSAELDQLENAHSNYWNIIRKSVGALSSLVRTQPGSQVEKAVKELKQACAQKRGNLQKVTAKVNALQSALMIDSSQSGAGAPSAQQKAGTGASAPSLKDDKQTALKGAISALAALAPHDPESAIRQAVDRLKALLDQKQINPAQINEASQALKTALLTQEESVPSGARDSLELELKADEPKALLGWRLAARLLSGMHLDDQEFDSNLNKVEDAVDAFLKSGELDKPALAMAADLMENLRSILERRHRDAQGALFEIVKELMKTEAELMRTVDQNGQQIISGGDKIQNEMGNRLANLVKDVSQAGDLDTMKSQILVHVQDMRENLAERISSQQNLVSATMQRVGQLKEVVNEAHNRIKLAEEKSRRWGREAMTDTLTGAWNRRALDMMLTRGMPDSGEGMCLLIMDIDQFRSLVQEWGSSAADKALVTIASSVRKCLRDTDYLFRYEADHFAAMLKGKDLTYAGSVAECMRAKVQSIKFTYQGLKPMRLTATVVAATPRENENPAQLWQRIHEVLKQVNQQGHSNKALTSL